MTSGEIKVSMEPAILRKKLLNPPNEARRQQTVDVLKIVHTSQDDPHYANIVSLVIFLITDPCAKDKSAWAERWAGRIAGQLVHAACWCLR